MKSERLLRILNDIDGKYILEANPIDVAQHISRKKITALILAAALALFLVSCGVVAVIYGDSIQSWFGFYWNRITGQDMEVEQTAIIDHLSQEIGESSAVGEVTVSMDSATVSEDIAIRDALNGVLGSLKPEHRKIFLRRYWYLSPVKEIAEDYCISESKVKMILLRTREKLKAHLESEGIVL